jgi:hypothetical protein
LTVGFAILSWRRLDIGGDVERLDIDQPDDPGGIETFVATTLPRSTRQVGAWIEHEFGLVYESRSGLIALLHRLGLEYHKPNVIPTKLDTSRRPSSRTMRSY